MGGVGTRDATKREAKSARPSPTACRDAPSRSQADRETNEENPKGAGPSEVGFRNAIETGAYNGKGGPQDITAAAPTSHASAPVWQAGWASIAGSCLVRHRLRTTSAEPAPESVARPPAGPSRSARWRRDWSTRSRRVSGASRRLRPFCSRGRVRRIQKSNQRSSVTAVPASTPRV